VFPLKDNIPTDRFPVVTVLFIVANVLTYFLFQKGGISLGDPSSLEYQCNAIEYGAIPYEIAHPGDELRNPSECGPADAPTWLTVLTSMFMHGGLLHLGGNMLFLWIFGNNVEDSMGPVKFVAFYVLGGVAAIAAQTLIDPSSTIPTIGASGAVAAVLGGYILLFPRARVITVIFIIFFFTILQLPAIVVLGLWFLQQVAFGYFGLAQPAGEGGGVAYFAHIGGFVFGLLLIKAFASERRRQRQLERIGMT
jgi:membrane associated rhomboid family serine protease